MFGYFVELKKTLLGLTQAGASFDISEIKGLLEEQLEEQGDDKYRDPIKPRDLKVALINLFERGGIPKYSIVLKPMVGHSGPYFILEFTPSNPMASLTLIEKPESGGKKTGCVIHPQYKILIQKISEIIGCSQDTLIRSLLINSLNNIHDQLK